MFLVTNAFIHLFIFFCREKCFRLMGTFPGFSAVFTKGNRFCDFLFVIPDNLVPKEFDPTTANYFNRSK